MTDIKVIERQVPEGRLLSREEREARLQEVAKTSKIPKFHFDNFLELEDEWLATESRREKPDITALLVRKLLQYDTIIQITIEKTNRLKNLDDINTFFNIPTLRRFGSAAPVKKPKLTKPPAARKKIPGNPKGKKVNPKQSNKPKYPQPEEITEKPREQQLDEMKKLTKPKSKSHVLAPKITGYTIPVTTDMKKFVHLAELKKVADDEIGNKYMYQTTRDETLEVSGIIINHKSPIMSYFRNKYPWYMSAITVIMSGAYSTEYIHNRLFSPFRITDQKLFTSNMDELIPGATEVGEYRYYLFNDENSAKQVCASLIEYMYYLEQVWASSKISSIITNAFNVSETIVEYPISTMPKYSELFKLIVIMLTKFQELPSPISEIVDTTYTVPKELTDFIKQVSPYMSRGERSIHFQSSLYNDFWADNMLVLLEKFLFTKNVEELRTFVTNGKKSKFVLAKQQMHDSKKFETRFTEMRYRWIFIQKFGWDKFQELYTDKPINQPILSIVQKSTRGILETTFTKIKKYTEAVQTNTCPHLKIESTMRMAESVSVKEEQYANLKKYMPPKERGLSTGVPIDYIQCINCKFNLICPHVRDEMELNKTNKS